ncbi:hypothetical protein, partial [Thermoflexus hugenholtzii]
CLRRVRPASGLLRAFEGIALGFPILWLIERFSLGTHWIVILGSLALIIIFLTVKTESTRRK